jgi:hypothetical protein
MINFLLLMGISSAACIGAAGYSVANIKIPERTPEEIRKDSIKGLVYSPIAIAFAHLFNALLMPQIASQVEEIVDGEILMKAVLILTGLLTLVCIARIVTALCCLWMYKDLGKEPENGEQEKKQENGNK